ncbi:hypothetical protein ACFQU7_02350 [Pseudoroseomonas wenyumeiae]
MTILSVRNATVTYDAILAVSDVSIEVPRGSIVTILGPNGAGSPRC